jgi:hypothetical protein
MIRLLPLPAAALVLAGSIAWAQPAAPTLDKAAPKAEKRATNLKVFPAEMPRERLIEAMRGFKTALGVECSYCHVEGDFASDANPHKEIARGMLRMTMRLNREALPAIFGPTPAGEEAPRVSCFTCHRGAEEPAVSPPAATPAPATPKA